MLVIICAINEWKSELASLILKFDIYTDYWVLKYFMTIKKLTFQQASWAEKIFCFNFLIWFCLKSKNELADVLTYYKKNVNLQNEVKKISHIIIMICSEYLNNEIRKKLVFIIKLAVLNTNLQLMNKLLLTNWQNETLQKFWKKTEKKSVFLLSNELLLHNN